MKMFKTFLTVFSFLILGMISPLIVYSATTPVLYDASSYAVLSSTFTNTTPGTIINGDIGFTTGPAVLPGGTHPNYGSGVPYASAGFYQGTAATSLSTQLCTFTFPAGAINLSTDVLHGAIGLYTPGVYCSSGAMVIGGPLTLSGLGTYIFRSDGALTSTAGSIITAIGASACDVFWTPTEATTLAANTTFIGTVLADAGITVGANTVWSGRALSFGGTVTTDADTITAPTCPVPVTPVSSSITVVKTVINDNGRTRLVSDFPLFVNGVSVVSGATNEFTPAVSYTISESTSADYDQSFSGDCDASGQLFLNSGDALTCIVINDDEPEPVPSSGGGGGGGSSGGGGGSPGILPLIEAIEAIEEVEAQVQVLLPLLGVSPPLIHVTKMVYPKIVMLGGGDVRYTVVVDNPGSIALSNVKLIDDTCRPLTFRSGDIDGDLKLDSNEKWRYSCSAHISMRTTNTVRASGFANGIIVEDVASVTVQVSSEAVVVPPTITLPSIPSFPSAGFAPILDTIHLQTIVITAIFAVVIIFLVVGAKFIWQKNSIK